MGVHDPHKTIARRPLPNPFRKLKSRNIFPVVRSGYALVIILMMLVFLALTTRGQGILPTFRVIGFYTAKNDRAHITFVHEANKWLQSISTKYNFRYDSTDNWNNLNTDYLSDFQVVLFLDTRPEDAGQRAAFQRYMENGGGWIGFHFAAFALSDSDFPQNWDWYHNTFLGSGEYVSNTWRPTTAVLRVEAKGHPVTRQLPETFTSAPNEWYRWKNDLCTNADVKILVSIDSTSFPLGTGPKPHEIWHAGYYPVVWTNERYNMLYMNMGHNDIDYENRSNKQLSSTFGSIVQDQMLIDAILWLGKRQR